MVGFASREYNRNDSPGTRIGLAERGISRKQNQLRRANLVTDQATNELEYQRLVFFPFL